MRRIQKRPLPVAVTEYLKKHPEASYGSDLPTDIKNQIRQHLHQEQHGFCAYCERNLPDLSRTVIEHFHPQSLRIEASDLACRKRLAAPKTGCVRVDLDPGNLLLSCDGHVQGRGSGGTDDLTCDKRKKDTHVCEALENPKQLPQSVTSIVTVNPAGRVVATRVPSESQQALTQGVIDQVLNLNSTWLIEKRSELIAEVKQQFNVRAQVSNNRGKLRNDFARRIRETLEGKDFASTRESLANEIATRGSA